MVRKEDLYAITCHEGIRLGSRFTVVNYAMLSVFLIIVLYPLIYVVSASFSSSSAVLSGKVWLWPVEPTLEGYRAVFKNTMVARLHEHTVLYAGRHCDQSHLSIMAAYPLSRKDFRGRACSCCCSCSRCCLMGADSNLSAGEGPRHD